MVETENEPCFCDWSRMTLEGEPIVLACANCIWRSEQEYVARLPCGHQDAYYEAKLAAAMDGGPFFDAAAMARRERETGCRHGDPERDALALRFAAPA